MGAKTAALTVVEFWRINGKYKAKAVQLAHKERVVGRNIVAVISGRLCKPWYNCKWCYTLEDRCAARRTA
jgi:hypothetical protein